MDVLNNKNNDNVKIGKYYDPSFDYNSALQEVSEQKELANLKSMWLNELNLCEEAIERYETQMEDVTEEAKQLETKAILQHLYEKRAVAEKFLPRFVSTNNLPLLRTLYNSGSFLSLKDAEKARAEHDNKFYFQSPDYKNLNRTSSFIKVILGILSLPGFILLLGGVALGIIGNRGYDLHPLGVGLMVFCYGIPVTLPIWGVIAMYLIPAFVDRIIMGDKISPEDKRKRTIGRAAGLTSAIISGAKAGHDIKKINEKYDKAYKE